MNIISTDDLSYNSADYIVYKLYSVQCTYLGQSTHLQFTRKYRLLCSIIESTAIEFCISTTCLQIKFNDIYNLNLKISLMFSILGL